MRKVLPFLLLLLTACGRMERLESPLAPELQKLFDRGRFHRYMPKQSGDSLSLVGTRDEIHSIKHLSDSPHASWLQFDVRLMPDVKAPALPELLPSVAERYGGMLGGLNIKEWLPAERFLRRDETRVFLNYRRVVHGLTVRDNVLQLVLMEHEKDVFRLSEIQSNITGEAPEASPAPPAETPGDKNAADAEWLQDLTGRDDVVLDKRSEEWIAFLEEGRFHWQKAVVFEWTLDGEHFMATLLPSESTWLDAYPLAVHAKPVLTRALKRSYAEDGPREYPLSFSAATSPTGNFELGPEAMLPNGYTPATVGLNGSRAMIIDNHALDSPSFAGLQEQANSFFLASDSTQLAAINAFVAVQRINRYARQFLSREETPFLSEPLIVHVNLAEEACNAYYSPRQQRLLLYKEGNGCANMALINDVVYHEWGHALDDHVGRSPGIHDPAFSEGLADIISAFYNNDPEIAPYFYFDDPSPLRRLTDARSYPDDQGPMHYEGGIISSTFWELRQELITRYGLNRGSHLAGKLFFRHLVAVDSYLESYAAVLRIDDDDGNPATPGPNHCLINAVFARHGLAESEACEDIVPLLPPVSQELTLALLDAGPEENAVYALAAAPEAHAMAICLGTRPSCLADRNRWQRLEPIGGQAQRAYFKLQNPLLMPALTLVTLLRLDAQGEVQDTRELKIFAK